MRQLSRHITKLMEHSTDKLQGIVIIVLCLVMLFPFDIVAAVRNSELVADTTEQNKRQPEIIEQVQTVAPVDDRSPVIMPTDSTMINEEDSVLTVVTADEMPSEFSGKRVFNPNPTRAVWMSVLCPGLGQIYNRRYWKLPIIVGGFMGLGYATAWNNNQLTDYTQGYRDLTDADPSTDSYMNFFPPNAQESDFDKQWLTNTMKSRKDYYRRNRDLCIICLVGLYLLCIVDAYVDASLAHFDISDNLSMDVQPVMFTTPVDNSMALGLNWAFNF